MYPTGAMRNGDQRVDPGAKQGVHVHEIHGKDILGLGNEELAPGRTRPARCGIDTGVVENLPHGRGSDVMLEPDQLTLHASVSPHRILGGDSDDKLLDRCCGRWTSELAA